MKLTDHKIRSLRTGDKPYKVSDGRGLYLLVHNNGSLYWKLKYRYSGKEKTLSIGVYPEVSLKEARESMLEARLKIKRSIDPSQEKQLKKLLSQTSCADNFEAITREWYENRVSDWTPRYAHYVITRMEADIFPILGARSIKEITAPELLAVLRIVEKRGAIDIAKRLLQTSGQVFRYAVSTGKIERDITPDLKGALKVRKKENFKYLKESDLPEFLEHLKDYKGEFQTKLGLKFLILTMVRTVELRGAKWSEVNFKERTWKIPAERMKMRREHWIPLSNQSIEILSKLKELNGDFVHNLMQSVPLNLMESVPLNLT